MNSPTSSSAKPEFDPIYLHCRREAWVILAVWAAAFAWTVPYCYFNGYLGSSNVSADNLPTVFGIPSWIFWGVGFPWLAADIVTIYLCTRFIVEDDLGAAHEGEYLSEEIA